MPRRANGTKAELAHGSTSARLGLSSHMLDLYRCLQRFFCVESFVAVADSGASIWLKSGVLFFLRTEETLCCGKTLICWLVEVISGSCVREIAQSPLF